jgi:o-succinylbenzoate synthase
VFANPLSTTYPQAFRRTYEQAFNERPAVKLERAELRVVRLPLKFRFETSMGVETEKVFPLLRLCSSGLEGLAEGVMDDKLPVFREETVQTAMTFLNEILPRLIGREFANPEALTRYLEPYRGNYMAKATIEMAFWDLWARKLGQPLHCLLGGVQGAIPVGVSIGIQKDIPATLEMVADHVEQGYKRVKLKIKPGWDVQPVSAVRAAFPKINLTVDANSAYSLADARVFQALDGLQLDYIEQPLAWNDIHDHAKLQAMIITPLCLDESISSAQDARKALESKACRVINIKVGRVGGHLEARKIHDVAAAFGAPVWCGGMLEAGIGRAHNIHLSSVANFTKPGDTSSASRYFDTDIINEALEVENGLMPIPAGAGIGVSLNQAFLETVTLQRQEFGA